MRPASVGGMAKGLNRCTGVRFAPDSLAFLLRERQWRDAELWKLIWRLSTPQESVPAQEVQETAERAGTDALCGCQPNHRRQTESVSGAWVNSVC